MPGEEDQEEAGAEGAGPEAGEGASKPRKTYGERAASHLRAARRGLKDVEDAEAKANYLVAEANVMAILDLADAVRNPHGGGAAE